MKIIIFGAAGFIGTNLTLELLKNRDNYITLVDVSKKYFSWINSYSSERIRIIESKFDKDTDFNTLLKNQDLVFHLVSTTMPTTSNRFIAQELESNVIVSAKMFEACVENKLSKVVFMSSGGTVYGKEVKFPLTENSQTYPITSYGLQKITIEKLLYLYNQIYQLDYSVIRLSNPYGPYQRPNGKLGAVTTFTYKALKGDEIIVYGDGTVVRDYIYIEDAIQGVLNIAFKTSKYKIFNLGSGIGTSLNELINIIKKTVTPDLKIKYRSSRNVDVPINVLDISRYKNEFGELDITPLSEGIKRTADFLLNEYEDN